MNININTITKSILTLIIIFSFFIIDNMIETYFLSICILCLVTFTLQKLKRKNSISISIVEILLLIYFFYIFISNINNLSHITIQNLLLNLSLISLLIISRNIFEKSDIKDKTNFIDFFILIILIATFQSIFSIFQQILFIMFNMPLYSVGVSGFFYSPNAFASFISISLWGHIYLLNEKIYIFKKSINIILLIVSIIALILSKCRGAWISLIFTSSILFFLLLKYSNSTNIFIGKIKKMKKSLIIVSGLLFPIISYLIIKIDLFYLCI